MSSKVDFDTLGKLRTGSQSFRQPLWGKYRAKVINNIDPLLLGRIQVEIPSLPGSTLNWCLPCVPYAGPQVGFFAIPPLDANVWIEFEGGDPNHPIWVGCFWSEGEMPVGNWPMGVPEVKVFKTEFNAFVLNDIPEAGGMRLESLPEAVSDPCIFTFSSEGINLAIPETLLTLTTASTTLETGDVAVTATAAIEMEATADISQTAGGAIEVSAGADVSMEAGGACEVTAGGDVAITAAGACEVTAGGDVAVTGGGACEVTGGGDVAVTAGLACEVTAGLDVAVTAGLACEVTAGADCAITAIGACEVTAVGVAITGATEVTGALLIDGCVPLMV